MGIDISIKGVPRQDFLSGDIWTNAAEILEGDDWTSLKNCTFLANFLPAVAYIENQQDKAMLYAFKEHYVRELDIDSKPFTIDTIQKAVEALQRYDDHVRKMPFCPAGWGWMNDENKAIVDFVKTIFEDRFRLFVFPWEAAPEHGVDMGSWQLQEILSRARDNALRLLPPDAVCFVRFC